MVASSDAQRFTVYDPACPSRQMLEHVTSRWGVLALAALRERPFRYSELRRRVGGVSEKMLAQTLHTLERDGFVKRVSHQQVPPRVEYSLTAQGHTVADLTAALVDWIEASAAAITDSQRRYDTGRRSS